MFQSGSMTLKVMSCINSLFISCTLSGNVSQATVSGEMTSYVLEDLEESSLYRITVESATIKGRSEYLSSAVYIETTAHCKYSKWLDFVYKNTTESLVAFFIC